MLVKYTAEPEKKTVVSAASDCLSNIEVIHGKGRLNFTRFADFPLWWKIKRWDKITQWSKILSLQSYPFPPISSFPPSPLPSLSVSLANNPLVSKLLRQPLGTQIALDQANLFCKGDLFNHLIFFGGHLFIWFPRLQRTLRGYSNKAGESNR